MSYDRIANMPTHILHQALNVAAALLHQCHDDRALALLRAQGSRDAEWSDGAEFEMWDAVCDVLRWEL